VKACLVRFAVFLSIGRAWGSSPSSSGVHCVFRLLVGCDVKLHEFEESSGYALCMSCHKVVPGAPTGQVFCGYFCAYDWAFSHVPKAVEPRGVVILHPDVFQVCHRCEVPTGPGDVRCRACRASLLPVPPFAPQS